jgi:transposase-like protein
LAVTAAEEQDCPYEIPPPAHCSSCTIRLRRLPLPARRNRRCCPLVLRFGLSYRDVEELLIERGVEVDRVTVYRWVQRFTPLLFEAAWPCQHRVGDRWQVDETFVKVAGQWRYIYHAIDQFGQVIDVFVSARRDAKAARRFFERAIGTTKITPAEVVTDHAPVYPIVSMCSSPSCAHTTRATIGTGREKVARASGRRCREDGLPRRPSRVAAVATSPHLSIEHTFG